MSLRDSPNIRINVELNTLSPKLFSVRVPAQRVAASGTNTRDAHAPTPAAVAALAPALHLRAHVAEHPNGGRGAGLEIRRGGENGEELRYPALRQS